MQTAGPVAAYDHYTGYGVVFPLNNGKLERSGFGTTLAAPSRITPS
jgi:hypothetical protein